MPLVAPNPTLRDALAAYVARTGSTKAEAATTLGVDPMTLARFLKSGRVIEANRLRIEAGLARVGAWHLAKGEDGETVDIVSSDKVIAALEFLLSAAREARPVGRTGR